MRIKTDIRYNWILQFKEGYTQVVNSFKKYDPEDTGQVSYGELISSFFTLLLL